MLRSTFLAKLHAAEAGLYRIWFQGDCRQALLTKVLSSQPSMRPLEESKFTPIRRIGRLQFWDKSHSRAISSLSNGADSIPYSCPCSIFFFLLTMTRFSRRDEAGDTV